MPSFTEPAARPGEVQRAGARSSRSSRARVAPGGGRRRDAARRHAGGAAGAGDVRSHRRLLRRHELGHDGRPAPPLARAARPTWPTSARATSALDVATGTGDLAVELAGRVGAGGEVVGSDFSEEMLDARAGAQGGPASRGSGATRWSCRTRRRPLRRRHRRLRRAQLLRPRRAAWPRWRAWCGPADASSSSRSRRRSSRRCRRSSRVWFDRIVPLIGRARRRARRLHVPAELGQALPRPGGARGGDGARRACATSAGSSPRAASSPCTWGSSAHDGGRGGAGHRGRPAPAGPHVPDAAGARRAAPAGARGRPRRPARRAMRARRSPPAASGCGRCWCSSPPATHGRRGPRARGDGGRARALGDARPRRRPRRRGAAPRACRPSWPAAGRERATATGDLLFARAFAELARQRQRRRGPRALRRAAARWPRASCCQRADAWDAAVPRRALPAPLRAEDRAPVRGRVPAGRARGGRRRRRRSAPSAARIGLAFQLLDDVLDVSGPASRTGKHRGTDLLDGTVTLPFILARERDPELAALDPRTITTPERGRARLRPDRRDRRAGRGAPAGARDRRRAPRRRCRTACRPRQRTALDLVADGVVARYA